MASRQPITTNTFQVALEDGAGGLQFDYGTLATPESRREYFQENGYVVHPGLLDPDLCARAVRCFEREVKPYGGCMYRQASANPERHVFNATGSVMNSLLNPLSVDGRRFPGFRSISETILAGSELFRDALVKAGHVLGENVILEEVQGAGHGLGDRLNEYVPLGVKFLAKQLREDAGANPTDH